MDDITVATFQLSAFQENRVWFYNGCCQALTQSGFAVYQRDHVALQLFLVWRQASDGPTKTFAALAPPPLCATELYTALNGSISDHTELHVGYPPNWHCDYYIAPLPQPKAIILYITHFTNDVSLRSDKVEIFAFASSLMSYRYLFLMLMVQRCLFLLLMRLCHRLLRALCSYLAQWLAWVSRVLDSSYTTCKFIVAGHLMSCILCRVTLHFPIQYMIVVFPATLWWNNSVLRHTGTTSGWVRVVVGRRASAPFSVGDCPACTFFECGNYDIVA